MTLVQVREFVDHNAPVHTLLPFGVHLISVDADNIINILSVWLYDANIEDL